MIPENVWEDQIKLGYGMGKRKGWGEAIEFIEGLHKTAGDYMMDQRAVSIILQTMRELRG